MSNQIEITEQEKDAFGIIQDLVRDLKREKGIKITVEKQKVYDEDVTFALTKFYDEERRSIDHMYFSNVEKALAAVEAIHDYFMLG